MSIEDVIRGLEQRGARAVLEVDADTMASIYDDSFVMHAPNNAVMSRQQVLDAMRSPTFSYTSFVRHTEQVFVSGDIAVSMGEEVMTPKGDHHRAHQELRRRYTHVWRLDGDTWRILVRHANVIRSPRE